MDMQDIILEARDVAVTFKVEGGEVNPFMPVPGMAGDQGAIPPEAIVGTEPDLEMPDEDDDSDS